MGKGTGVSGSGVDPVSTCPSWKTLTQEKPVAVYRTVPFGLIKKKEKVIQQQSLNKKGSKRGQHDQTRQALTRRRKQTQMWQVRSGKVLQPRGKKDSGKSAALSRRGTKKAQLHKKKFALSQRGGALRRREFDNLLKGELCTRRGRIGRRSKGRKEGYFRPG